MTRTNLANRLAKLEPKARPVNSPNILSVRCDGTTAETLARFNARYAGKIKPRHGLLIVPQRDATDEDHADFDAKFAEQQVQLQADARAIRLKVVI